MACRLLCVMLHKFNSFIAHKTNMSSKDFGWHQLHLWPRKLYFAVRWGKTLQYNHAHKTIQQRHCQFPSTPALLLSKADWCFLGLIIQLLHNYSRAELCQFSVCFPLTLIYLLYWHCICIERQLFVHNKGFINYREWWKICPSADIMEITRYWWIGSVSDWLPTQWKEGNEK